uniref:Uncharacterized protein n=1 Tax=Romanomermis culicivorax TaxID=13658 RepID=A0A915J9S4_ROMCU
MPVSSLGTACDAGKHWHDAPEFDDNVDRAGHIGWWCALEFDKNSNGWSWWWWYCEPGQRCWDVEPGNRRHCVCIGHGM